LVAYAMGETIPIAIKAATIFIFFFIFLPLCLCDD
jgi:hypothetical protein